MILAAVAGHAIPHRSSSATRLSIIRDLTTLVEFSRSLPAIRTKPALQQL
jgi:hypothetical protein